MDLDNDHVCQGHVNGQVVRRQTLRNTLISLHFNVVVLTFRNLLHFIFAHFCSLTFWQLATNDCQYSTNADIQYSIIHAASDKY